MSIPPRILCELLMMSSKTYHINIAPSTGIGIGFVVPAENESHAIAQLSYDLRRGLKIQYAHMSKHPDSHSRQIWEQKWDRNREILRVLRKPGRNALDRTDFYNSKWPKVTVKQIESSITTAYVNEVWLGRN